MALESSNVVIKFVEENHESVHSINNKDNNSLNNFDLYDELESYDNNSDNINDVQHIPNDQLYKLFSRDVKEGCGAKRFIITS